MARVKGSWLTVISLIGLVALPVWAETPEDTPENSFKERIVSSYDKSADSIEKGLREVRETRHTDGALIAYEATDSLVEGDELLDEVVAWSVMYAPVKGEDVVRFKKARELLLQKQKLVKSLVTSVGERTSNVNAVVSLKKELKSVDKKFAFQIKAIKGEVKLIPGKPLPLEAEK